jgi:hypothetical protein
MHIFDELIEIYGDLDQKYAIAEFKARSQGHTRVEAKYKRKRLLNDQATFLFAFTRLEDRISSLATALFASKVSVISNYKNKRAWEILKDKNKNDRITLMEKVSFLTPNGGASYNSIDAYKKHRNDIAHGGIATTLASMQVVLSEMKILFDTLG